MVSGGSSVSVVISGSVVSGVSVSEMSEVSEVDISGGSTPLSDGVRLSVPGSEEISPGPVILLQEASAALTRQSDRTPATVFFILNIFILTFLSAAVCRNRYHYKLCRGNCQLSLCKDFMKSGNLSGAALLRMTGECILDLSRAI